MYTHKVHKCLLLMCGWKLIATNEDLEMLRVENVFITQLILTFLFLSYSLRLLQMGSTVVKN